MPLLPVELTRAAAIVGLVLVAAVSGGCSTASQGAHARITTTATPDHSASPARRPRGSLVSSAMWTHPAEGYRIEIRPSGYGRRRIPRLSPAKLARVLAAAGHPPFRLTAAVRDSLVNQLRCHAVFAPHKPVWDLEAWRPDVGYVDTVLHGCNP